MNNETTATGECCHCGKSSNELQDDFCPDCFYEYHVYCTVCGEWHYEESLCSHVFWNRAWGWWSGSGAEPSDRDLCRESFIKMAEKTGLVVEIRAALVADDFDCELGDMTIYNMRLGLNGTNYGPFEDLENLEELEEGYEWFRSLEPGVTKEATQRTIGWIDEYLKGKK